MPLAYIVFSSWYQGRRQPPKYGVDKQAKRKKIWGLGAGPQKIFWDHAL